MAGRMGAAFSWGGRGIKGASFGNQQGGVEKRRALRSARNRDGRSTEIARATKAAAGVLCLICTALPVCTAASHADVVDDFSEGGWTRFESTPGELSVHPGKLHLEDASGPPTWVTTSKTFTVDIDRTPFFLVKVSAASDRGTVKLIRKEPHDKRVAVEIDRPGLYAVDMRQRFGWKGVARIETCLYAIGDEEEITFAYVKYAAQLTQKEKAIIKDRAAGGNVRLDVSPFEVVPLFHTCSFYFQSPPRPGLSVAYRRDDGPWHRAFPPVYVEQDDMFRGSIVGLTEDTRYELKITSAEGKVLAQEGFRTWSSQVPIGKTIILDEKSFPGRLAVTESGAPDGWLKITSRKGCVLQNDRTGPLIELYKVKYVLLEGLSLRGGLKEAITIRRCEHVRVVNCDISGWGRVGTQRFDLDGKYYTDEGHAINWDSAILVSKSLGTVVERCYIHDPVSTANSWYYSHPAGPQAVGMDKSPSTVLRYNDFVGSDEHRWNDAVEGAGNFHLDGGFHRDGDIYGNMMCFANDDALEIDGGQTNVRVFFNKFEGCLCGVSIQGCMSGPSYVFRNLLVNMGDERGLAGQTIKTSSHANGPGAVSFIFGNTCFGGSNDLNLRHNLRIVAKNNIFAGRSAIQGRSRSPQSECDYNLLSTGGASDEEHGIPGPPEFVDVDAGLFALRKTSNGVSSGVPIDNFAPGEDGRPDMGAIPFGSDFVLPVRPIPIDLDRHQLVFSASDVRSGRAKSVSVTVRGETFSGRYRIARNEAFDWFEVSPKAGQLRPGKTQTFLVKPRLEVMKDRPLYRGAFLVRLDTGYSRPVMVYARTDVVPEARPREEGAWVAYAEAEALTGSKAYEIIADPSASGGKCLLLAGQEGRNPVEHRFSITETGAYFVLLRVKSEKPGAARSSVYFGVNDGPFDRARLRSAGSWGWSLAAHNREMSLICLQAFELAPGNHTLKLAPQGPLYIDLVAVTDNPKMFER